MRAVVLSLMLAGCATTPALVEGQPFEVLTPAQLEQGFQDRAVCMVYPDDGACEAVAYAASFGARTRVVREVGVDDIAALVSDGMGAFVQQLPMFPAYDELFARLERQRVAGDFKCVKKVSVSELTLEPETGRWCSRVALEGQFEETQFYFSNTLSSDIAADERLDPAAERDLRAFLRAVIADRDFRSGVEARARENGELETFERLFGMLDGALPLCTTFSGIVEGARIELTRMTVSVGGHEEPTMGREIRRYTRDDVVPLRAN